MTTDFVWFTKIVLRFKTFRTIGSNLRKSDKISRLYFGLICEKISWSDKEQPVTQSWLQAKWIADFKLEKMATRFYYKTLVSK